MSRPWFWLVFVGVLFGFPLIKGLGAHLPESPPGIDTAPLEFQLPDDVGRLVSRADLAGHLLVIAELAYLNVLQHEEPLKRLRELRKRLRALYGEDPAELDTLVTTAGILANWPGADPAPGG